MATYHYNHYHRYDCQRSALDRKQRDLRPSLSRLSFCTDSHGKYRESKKSKRVVLVMILTDPLPSHYTSTAAK